MSKEKKLNPKKPGKNEAEEALPKIAGDGNAEKPTGNLETLEVIETSEAEVAKKAEEAEVEVDADAKKTSEKVGVAKTESEEKNEENKSILVFFNERYENGKFRKQILSIIQAVLDGENLTISAGGENIVIDRNTILGIIENKNGSWAIKEGKSAEYTRILNGVVDYALFLSERNKDGGETKMVKENKESEKSDTEKIKDLISEELGKYPDLEYIFNETTLPGGEVGIKISIRNKSGGEKTIILTQDVGYLLSGEENAKASLIDRIKTLSEALLKNENTGKTQEKNTEPSTENKKGGVEATHEEFNYFFDLIEKNEVTGDKITRRSILGSLEPRGLVAENFSNGFLKDFFKETRESNNIIYKISVAKNIKKTEYQTIVFTISEGDEFEQILNIYRDDLPNTEKENKIKNILTPRVREFLNKVDEALEQAGVLQRKREAPNLENDLTRELVQNQKEEELNQQQIINQIQAEIDTLETERGEKLSDQEKLAIFQYFYFDAKEKWIASQPEQKKGLGRQIEDWWLNKNEDKASKVSLALVKSLMITASTLITSDTTQIGRGAWRALQAVGISYFSDTKAVKDVLGMIPKIKEKFDKLEKWQKVGAGVLAGGVAVGAGMSAGIIGTSSVVIGGIGAGVRFGVNKAFKYVHEQEIEKNQIKLQNDVFNINGLVEKLDKFEKQYDKNKRSTEHRVALANLVVSAGVANTSMLNSQLEDREAELKKEEEDIAKRLREYGYTDEANEIESKYNEKTSAWQKFKNFFSFGNKTTESAKAIEEKTDIEKNSGKETEVDLPNQDSVATEAEEAVQQTETKIETSNESVKQIEGMDAKYVVDKGLGVTHAFREQVKANPNLGKELADQIGYKGKIGTGAFYKALGEKFGYIDEDGREVRVKWGGKEGMAAYEFVKEGDVYVVKEHHLDGGKWVHTETHGSDREIFEGGTQDNIENPKYNKDEKHDYEYLHEKKSAPAYTDDAPPARPGIVEEQPTVLEQPKNVTEEPPEVLEAKPEEVTPEEQAPAQPKERKNLLKHRTLKVGYSTDGAYKTEGAYGGTRGDMVIAMGPDGRPWIAEDFTLVGKDAVANFAIATGYGDFTEEQIKFVAESYKYNLKSIFGRSTDEWEYLSEQSAAKLMAKGVRGSVDTDKEMLVVLMQNFHSATGKYPVDNGESAKDYILRMTLELERRGQLEEFNERFDGYLEKIEAKIEQEADAIQDKNMEEMFPGYQTLTGADKVAFQNILSRPAKTALGLKVEDASPQMKPLVYHLHDLQKETGLSPNKGETVEEYIDRATTHAVKTGKADDITLEKKELKKFFKEQAEEAKLKAQKTR